MHLGSLDVKCAGRSALCINLRFLSYFIPIFPNSLTPSIENAGVRVWLFEGAALSEQNEDKMKLVLSGRMKLCAAAAHVKRPHEVPETRGVEGPDSLRLWR